MKNIQAEDLRKNINNVLDSSQTQRVVISRGGKPSAILVGIEGYDAEDLRLATSPEFWRMIGQRRTKGKSLSLEKVEQRLTGKSRNGKK